MNAKIRKAEGHKAQEYHNADNAVAASENLTEGDHYCHTKDHSNENLKKVDCGVLQFFFLILTASDQSL